jgi:RHS repeat-associated protein
MSAALAIADDWTDGPPPARPRRSHLVLVASRREDGCVATHDPLNRRTRTEQEIGSSQLASVTKSTIATTYGYDRVGNPTSERLPNGNTNSHTYDALNRLRGTTDNLGPVLASEYDANGNRTRETDARGNSTTKVYDDLNRLTEANLPEGRRMSYQYDLAGNKTRETDPNTHSTGFAYDVLNRLETVTDPLGRTLAYTYDAVGNRLTERDKRGHSTRFDYDDLNRLTQTTDALSQVVSFVYDRVGNKTTETDKRGTQTTYTYDKENRPLTTQKAGVPLLRVEYDELGRKKFETDANHNVSTYIYDDGRSLLLLESRPLAAITQHQYDALGDRIGTRDPEGRLSTSTFDLRRRLLTESNGENQITTYTYDGNGNRLTLRRPLGNTWTSVYDNANRLTTLTDPLSGATRFTYDGNGNRLTQTDANNRTTTYEYDALNRQGAMVYPDNARAEFRYDENGNRTGLTDPKGQVFSTVFDALNRETRKNYPLPPAPTGDDLQAIATQYDPNGNPTRVTETYSGATGSRVTTKSFDAFDRPTAVTDAFGKTLGYQFDANGNRTALTDPDGKVTRYGYDALNRVASVVNPGGVTNYEYDRSSLQTRVGYPNGTTAAHTYDRARRSTAILNKQGAATVSSYAYTYDANGNRTQQVETNGPTPETTTYRFDTTDRLTQAAYPDKTTTYTYDPAYNRLTERTVNATTETDKTYAYNNRNQLTTVTDNLNSANSVAYTYDVNGNQTQKTRSGTTTTFAYDVKDQLLSVRENTTTLGVFVYDYQGLRVSKDMGGSTVRTTYDDQSVLLQTDINGQTIAKYDYGPNRLLSLTHTTEGRQFYLFDALGSVSNLTTPAGAIQARYQYDAFGNQRAQAGSSYNRFTFTGHEQDQETNLYYFKARFYDPDTGRFLNQDPYLGDINTPPSLHRYLYAYSNPLVYIDLTGYESEDEREARQQVRREQKERINARLQAEFERTGDPRLDPSTQEEQRRVAVEREKEQAAQQREIDRREKKGEVTTVEDDQGSISTRRVDDEFAQGTPGQQQLRRANEVGRKAAEVGEEVTEILIPVPGVGVAVGITKVIGKGAGRIIKREADEVAGTAKGAEKTAAKSVPTKVKWVDENAAMGQKARDYNDAATGARSNVATRMGQAPAIERTMEDGSKRLVRFDGLDGNVLVDRKVSVMTTQKAKDQALRQSQALTENGLSGRWEVPTESQAVRAKTIFNELGIRNIDVKIIPQK